MKQSISTQGSTNSISPSRSEESLTTSEPVVSISRSLAQLLSHPSNRSCADCRVTLVDASQVYVSVSPVPEIPHARYNHFLSNHANFAPPGQVPDGGGNGTKRGWVPMNDNVPDHPIDPALVVASRTGGHGVFICAMCAAAHKLLGPTVAVVHAVQDTSAPWTRSMVQFLERCGGNARATTVLEAHVPTGWSHPRAKSSIADRLTFIRAKYEALAFVLPPTGPIATRAWHAIVRRHPEWKGLWGADLMTISDLHMDNVDGGTGGPATGSSQSLKHLLVDRNAQLPNRLVDHFLVIDHSPYLAQPFATHTNLQSLRAPEDIVLSPVVTDCYPEQGTHEDMEFPEHIGAFVCPEGYRPSSMPQPPTFFTFVLTCADGNRLYGGALRVYDKSYGLDVLRQSFVNSGYTDQQPPWLQEGAPEASDIIYLPKCLLILSHHPFFDLWRKVLQSLYRIVLMEAPLPIERFIANFCSEVPLPPPGRIQVRFGFTANQIWPIERPPENVLPMANFSFRPLFASLSISNVMVVLGCLMQEAKVALLSRHYALLTPVAEALMSLLFPLRWQGLYIPIMPYAMLDILDSPVPYLVGLHSRYLREIPRAHRPMGVVYVDLDSDVVHLGYDDETNSPRQIPSLPEKDAAKLLSKLTTFAAPAYLMPDSNKVGTIVSGDGKLVPQMQRETYARVTPGTVHGHARRREFFRAVDKAYTDQELMQPMTGFLSEQGQYHGGESVSQPTESHRVSRLRNLLKMKTRQSSFGSQTSAENDSMDGDTPHESLLDLQDPKGFSTSEVRKAFLRFFVSIFRDYRTYMGIHGFNADGFVANLNLSPGDRNFVAILTQTQLFQRFLQERRESPHDPECIFFEASINAKINRSKLTALANLGRGGKRDTAFLDDNSKKITDVYTPPPPSNLGLPGRTYHYGCFPNLDTKLFGKTRKPHKWPVKTMTIRTLRSSAIMEKESMNLFGARAFGRSPRTVTKPHVVQTAKSGSKRSSSTLEEAIESLSRPYALNQAINIDPGRQASLIRRDTNVSDVTLSSDVRPIEATSSAEEIVLNARRKVSILLAIFVELQSICRGYISRHPRIRKAIEDSAEIDRISEHAQALESKNRAAKVLFRMVLIFRARRMLLQARGAAIMIQANFRRRRAELVFGLVKQAIATLQARVRRWIVQRRLIYLISERMKVYAPQVFALWKKGNTSLAYRTRFWQYVKSSTLLCHGIVETELTRLMKENPQTEESRSVSPELSRLIRDSDRLGMAVNILRQCMMLEGNSSEGERDSLRASFSSLSEGPAVEAINSTDTAARVAAERTQIYEKLSNLSNGKAECAENLYAKFEVPLKDKRRKATLSQMAWNKYGSGRLADESVELMVLLFPELGHSTNIKYSAVTKKGIRRIRSSVAIPPPLEELKWAHVFLDRRIRKNLAEVASVAMLYLPRRYHSVRGGQNSSSKEQWQNAITEVYKYSSWKECRLQIMRRFVHQLSVDTFALSARSAQSFPQNKGSSFAVSKQASGNSPMFPDLLPVKPFPDLLPSEQQ